jgi:hypothetical protein
MWRAAGAYTCVRLHEPAFILRSTLLPQDERLERIFTRCRSATEPIASRQLQPLLPSPMPFVAATPHLRYPASIQQIPTVVPAADIPRIPDGARPRPSRELDRHHNERPRRNRKHQVRSGHGPSNFAVPVQTSKPLAGSARSDLSTIPTTTCYATTRGFRRFSPSSVNLLVRRGVGQRDFPPSLLPLTRTDSELRSSVSVLRIAWINPSHASGSVTK